MSNRRSTRRHRAPLNPEEGAMPLVDRAQRSNTFAEDPIENAPPSQLPPGMSAEDSPTSLVDHLPDTQTIAPAPTLDPLNFIEKEVSADGYCDNVLKKLLQDAKEMGCHYDSQRAEAIREANAPSHPSSRRNEEPGSTSSEGSDRLETRATNEDDTTEGGEFEEVVIAIGLHRTTGEMEEAIMTMKVRSLPRVDKVVERAKREDDSTQNLRRMLELIPSQRVLVATAKKLVRVHQVADLQGKWGDGFKVLGKMEDIEILRWHLQPCDPCPEAVEIRTAAKPPALSSSPIFVMYFIELDVSEPYQDGQYV